MFQNILIPTDFSGRDSHAIDIARELCSPGDGKITLLHVIEIIANTTLEEFDDFYKELEERSLKHLNRLASSHDEDTFTIEKRIIYGNRAKEILRFAEENSIDLIIMTSHKIDIEDRAQGWGSISYKVGIVSQCPVMLVK
jgi:nucleotide-binding universal stress UspA family protein